MTVIEATSRSIARHDIGCDETFAAERLAAEERLFDNARNHLAQRPVNMSGMFRRALDAAGWRAVLSAEDPLIHRDLQRAARCARAMVEMIGRGDQPVTVALPGEPPLQVARVRINDILTPDKLRLGLYAAIICRDRAALEALCRVNVRMAVPPDAIVDDYAVTMVEFLQGLATKASWSAEKLVQVLDETEPDRLQTGNVDAALYIATGEIDCFAGLSSDDPAVFNGKLAKALAQHRRFYDIVQVNPGEEQRNDPRGFIALGPLAAAALAHDRGRAVTVQSDYLPPALLDGRFAA